MCLSGHALHLGTTVCHILSLLLTIFLGEGVLHIVYLCVCMCVCMKVLLPATGEGAVGGRAHRYWGARNSRDRTACILYVDAHVGAFNLLGIVKMDWLVSRVRGLERGIREAIDLEQILERLQVWEFATGGTRFTSGFESATGKALCLERLPGRLVCACVRLCIRQLGSPGDWRSTAGQTKCLRSEESSAHVCACVSRDTSTSKWVSGVHTLRCQQLGRLGELGASYWADWRSKASY